MLHHITLVKCLNGCPKIVLGTGMVVYVKLQFPGPTFT
jgi:hypothetical protein